MFNEFVKEITEDKIKYHTYINNLRICKNYGGTYDFFKYVNAKEMLEFYEYLSLILLEGEEICQC
ncbi:MAG: hypothetical protein ACRCX8_20365 [Sarcina sp.]